MKILPHALSLSIAILSLTGTSALSAADVSSDNSAAAAGQTANADAAASANVNDAKARQTFDADKNEVRRKLNEQLSDATDFYATLQSKAETEISSHVVAQAKGILIINRWSGGAGVDATGGYAVGFKRMGDGKFSAPVFYSLAGASLGVQVGGEKTHTIAFLMSDKALRTLTEGKFVWSGNVKAVAGTHSSSDTTIDNSADVILYTKAAGLDVGAAVAGTDVSLDLASTQKFYDKPTLSVDDVFTGKVSSPAFSKTVIVTYFNQQSAGIKPLIVVNGTTNASVNGAVRAINTPGSPNVGVGVGAGAQQTVNGAVSGVVPSAVPVR